MPGMITIQERRRRQNRIAAVIGLAVLLLVISFGWFFLANRDVSRDLTTNCPVSGPDAYTAIVIDRSERYDPSHVRAVRQLFNSWLLGMPEDVGTHVEFNTAAFSSNTLVQLYVMNQDSVGSIEGVKPLVSKCMGLRPDEISANESIFVNSRLLGIDLEQFVATVSEEITGLLDAPQGNSPIMEMVGAMATSEFAADFNKPHYLIVVSDMIQETAEYSHRRNAIEFDEWERLGQPIFGDLRGTEWEIVYLRRSTDEDIQTRGHQLFWEEFFDSLNAGQGRFIVR